MTLFPVQAHICYPACRIPLCVCVCVCVCSPAELFTLAEINSSLHHDGGHQQLLLLIFDTHLVFWRLPRIVPS